MITSSKQNAASLFVNATTAQGKQLLEAFFFGSVKYLGRCFTCLYCGIENN